MMSDYTFRIVMFNGFLCVSSVVFLSTSMSLLLVYKMFGYWLLNSIFPID